MMAVAITVTGAATGVSARPGHDVVTLDSPSGTYTVDEDQPSGTVAIGIVRGQHGYQEGQVEYSTTSGVPM
jgi:hypothetical protein